MRKILTVDNDQIFLEFMKEILEKEGHAVKTARNGLEALDALEGFTPDCVFCDAIMPNIDGKRLCRILRRMDHLHHTKIIIVSSVVRESESELLKCGADYFISKGPLAELAADIRHLLHRISEPSRHGDRFTYESVRCKPRTVTKELLSENRHLELLLDRLSEAILEVMPDGRIVHANRAATRFTGVPEEQLLGIPIQSIFAEKDRNRVESFFKKSNEHPDKISEDPLPQLNGLEVSLEIIPILNNENKKLVILENLSRQRAAARALKKSEEKYRCLVEQSLQGLVIAQEDPIRLTFVSKPMEAILGYATEELETFDQNALTALIHPEDRERFFENFRNRLLGHEGPAVNEYRIIHKTQGTRWVEIFSTRISYDGKPASHSVFVDITDRKLAEEKSEKLEAELLQSQKMESVGRLAGGVAHDFNNNLAVILGYTELMLAGMDVNESPFREIHRIHEAAQRSAALTKQLLAFARKQTILPVFLNLNEKIEGMLKMLRRLIGEHIDLGWKPDTKLQPVRMDPNQVDQILANLCVNAGDAVRGSGEILIETRHVLLDDAAIAGSKDVSPKEYAVLAISDTGEGMDKETLDHVFEPFFTTKAVGEGTGLGLSTVFGIVKQNNGFMRVKSTPGKGTTFEVYLPACKDKANQQASQKTHLPVQGQGQTILLVEDEATVLDLSREILQNMGYHVLAANGPKEALETAQRASGEIHLLITDVVMPHMGGNELARAIAKIEPNIQTLFMSGYTSDVIGHQGVLDEGVHFIEKPFSMKELGRKVKKILEKADNSTKPEKSQEFYRITGA